MSICKFKKIHEAAVTPIRASAGAAGFDVTTIEKKTIAPLSAQTFRTGLQITYMERGVYAQLYSRSGLIINGVMCVGGVIDSDYRKEIIVVLYNLSPSHEKIIYKGDRICQMIFFHHLIPLLPSPRQPGPRRGGFGSSGYFTTSEDSSSISPPRSNVVNDTDNSTTSSEDWDAELENQPQYITKYRRVYPIPPKSKQE